MARSTAPTSARSPSRPSSRWSEKHVADARERGARILTGGERGPGPGDWYEPTVIADADHSMEVMQATRRSARLSR